MQSGEGASQFEANDDGFQNLSSFSFVISPAGDSSSWCLSSAVCASLHASRKGALGAPSFHATPFERVLACPQQGTSSGGRFMLYSAVIDITELSGMPQGPAGIIYSILFSEIAEYVSGLWEVL